MFDRYPIIVLLQTNVARSSEADLLQLEICVPELTRSIFSIGLFVKSLVGLESKTQFIAYFNNEVPNRIKLKNGPVFFRGGGVLGWTISHKKSCTAKTAAKTNCAWDVVGIKLNKCFQFLLSRSCV